MISRRKFLAGAIAAAVAPSVAPELASNPSGMAIMMQNGPTIGDAILYNGYKFWHADNFVHWSCVVDDAASWSTGRDA